MITITINGLDQFIVEKLSKDTGKILANLFEVDEKEINFVAPQSMIFYHGVEQTSWHVIVSINAPEEVKHLQKNVAEFLISRIKDVAINIEIFFDYFSRANRFEHTNKEYPPYITEKNLVNLEEENEDEDEEIEEELYEGNIFDRLKGGRG